MRNHKLHEDQPAQCEAEKIFLFLRLTCARAGVDVGLKTENRKINEKRPSAVIKAILGTVNSITNRLLWANI